MIEVIAEHSVDLSLLPEKAFIADIGCRGFEFTKHFKSIGHHVYPVDIDLFEHFIYNEPYFMLAISGEIGKCGIEVTNDPQGTRIKRNMKSEMSLDMHTIYSFSAMVGVKFWDVIKIDIEGSEYEVIMSLTEPPAKQLSIEFHLHTGIYGNGQVKEMENKLLSLGYFPAKHDKTSQHGAGFNYWDSLWILR